MLILSLDSTAETASAALSDGERYLAGVTLNVGNKHSTTLLPAVRFILDQAGVRVSDVELFALSAGPGSFTGVRIGAATVKGLTLGRTVPCIGVSSLEAMAEGFAFADGIVCPMINARRDRYFTAFFSATGGTVTRLTDDGTLEGASVEDFLLSQNRRIYLTGDGAEVYLRSHGAGDLAYVPEILKYPSSYYAGVLAGRIYDSADAAARAEFTAENLRPIYLRQPQAERELMEKNANK